MDGNKPFILGQLMIPIVDFMEFAECETDDGSNDAIDNVSDGPLNFEEASTIFSATF
jgi:hypothetical protein